MSDNTPNIYGKYADDGSIESWPDVNIAGSRVWDKSDSRLGLPGKRFVILTGNTTDAGLIEQLTTITAKPVTIGGKKIENKLATSSADTSGIPTENNG